MPFWNSLSGNLHYAHNAMCKYHCVVYSDGCIPISLNVQIFLAAIFNYQYSLFLVRLVCSLSISTPPMGDTIVSDSLITSFPYACLYTIICQICVPLLSRNCTLQYNCHRLKFRATNLGCNVNLCNSLVLVF